jgi:hypothetical protein
MNEHSTRGQLNRSTIVRAERLTLTSNYDPDIAAELSAYTRESFVRRTLVRAEPLTLTPSQADVNMAAHDIAENESE